MSCFVLFLFFRMAGNARRGNKGERKEKKRFQFFKHVVWRHAGMLLHIVLSQVFRAISKHFVVCIFLIVCRTKSENERRLEEATIAVAIHCDYD